MQAQTTIRAMVSKDGEHEPVEPWINSYHNSGTRITFDTVGVRLWEGTKAI